MLVLPVSTKSFASSLQEIIHNEYVVLNYTSAPPNDFLWGVGLCGNNSNTLA